MDYNFYQMEYGGKAPIELFPRLLIRAMTEVKYYTHNRANDNDINVKYALCELIDYMYKLEQTDNKEIASEKVGTYSITYEKEDKNTIDKKKKRIIYKHLGHTGLLYRGM